MLEVKNIRKTYRPKRGQPVKALDGISIRFPEKGLVFILGKSGSGKSTLLNVLGGLDKVDEGEIIIKGKSSKDFSQADFDSYRNTYLGFIFQEYNILDEFTVGDNIALALQLQGKKATEEEIERILKEVDLSGFAKRKPNELSGGQKQRIAIARALIKNPEIILADEPTGALDSKTGIQVFDTLRSLSRDKLVIVVSHDREFAEMYGDRVIEMKDGKIISDIEKFKEKPQASDTGLITIDDHMLALKKGHVLTEKDIAALNKVLQENDTLISADNNVNKEFRRIARIDENLNREAFKDTDESKIQYGNDGKFSLIKSSLPFGNAFRIGISALKSKPLRLFLTILLSFCAFGMFGIVDTASTYSPAKTVVDGLRNNSLTDTFSLEKQEKYVPEGGTTANYYSALITDDDMTQIENELGISIDPVYTDNIILENTLGSTSNPLYSGNNPYGVLGLSEERRSDLGFTMIKGYYPTKNDEIAISDYIYCYFKEVGYHNGTYMEEVDLKPEDISPDTLIGRKLVFGNDSYTITGILDTGFGLDPSMTPYADLAEASMYDISQDNRLKNLYSQLNYNVKNNYGGCLYLSESRFDILVNKNGFYDASDFDMDNGRIQSFFNFDGLGFNFSNFGPQSSVTVQPHFTVPGKTKLARNEFLLSNGQYGDFLQKYFEKNATPLQDEDKAIVNWQLNPTYSEDGTQNGWKLTPFEVENETVDQLLASAPDSYIMDYAKDHMPTTEAFERYVKEFYRYAVNSTGPDGKNDVEEWRDFPESQITEDFRAYAYGCAIVSPYSVIEAEPGKYSQETVSFFQSYLDAYSLQGSQNVFGGKTYDSLNEEWREPIYGKYAPETLDMKGYFQCVPFGSETAPEEEEFRIVGYFDTSDDDNQDYDYCAVISDDLFQDFAPYLHRGFQSVLLSDGGDLDSILPLIQSTYEEDSKTRYVLNNAVSDSIASFNTLIQMISSVFFYVALGMAIFSALLLMNFISVSISYKKREIGILRAVGAKASDVFKIFFSEAFVIAIINFVIAAIGAGIGSYLMNNMVVEAVGSLGNFFLFGIRQVAIMLAISIGVSFVASFLPVYLVARKRPVEAIRSN